MAPVSMTALQRLANRSSALTAGDIPPAVRAVARNCILDTIGVALAGSRSKPVAIARALALEHAATGPARLFGWPEHLAAPAAAAINATAAHALDFDDNCYAGVVHGSAIVLPAVLAAAGPNGASGADLVTAFVAGVEAEYALGEAMSSGLYARGWWTTAVLGTVGAAAGVSRMLGLDADRTAQALGLALAGTGGTKAAFGSDAKALIAGRTAEAGLLAAWFVGGGARGPVDALEHRLGFATLFNEGRIIKSAFDEPRWRLLSPGIDVKRIPVCLSAHAAVDAVEDLVRSYRLEIGRVRSVNCDVPQVVADNLRYPSPRTVPEAKFSLQFAIAASLVFGALRLDHLAPETLADRRVVALMERIEMRVGERWSDPALLASAPEGAHVCIVLEDGTRLEGFRASPRGSAADPLDEAALRAKFRACAGLVLDRADAETLLDRLMRVDELASISDLFMTALQE